MPRIVLSLLLALAAAFPAVAQTWPARPVRMILSQPPGSSPDILARLLGERLSRQWGQGVVVENRPGGQNVVGAQAAARATPDGYTFYYATTAALVVNVYTFKSLPYDPRKDFVPVTMIGLSPFVLAVNPSVPARTLAELVAWAKANPDALTIATEGTKTLSGLLTDMIVATGGMKATHVPYNGVQPGILDTIQGRTLATVQSSTALSAHLKRGALRPIAVSFPKRVTGLEQVPTLGETWPGFQYSKAATDHAPLTGVWDADKIFAYLPDPSKFLGGTSKMVFKLPDEKERKDVIAYLSQFDIDGKKKP